MKQYFSTPLFVLSAMLLSQAIFAEPSRVFTQETATIETAGSVSLELNHPFPNADLSSGLRVGAFGGVVLVNSHTEMGTRMGFEKTNVGFKRRIRNNMVAYGVISYSNDAKSSGLDLAIGAAYTVKSGTLTYNINPELITDQANVRGGRTTLFIKGGILYPLIAVTTGNLSVVVEVSLESNPDLDPISNLGLRWVPRPDITLDFILYSDRGRPAGVKDIQEGIPGWIKVNIRF